MTVVPALLAVVALAAAPGPAPLTAKERAGRLLYREGKSPSGSAVHAMVGGTSLSAELVSCAGCHGDDGLGRPEGGVRPTPIQWGELTKPWGRSAPSGRRHPAYDARTLGRAVTQGVDAGGNALDAAMPRYSMSRADLDALVAYLARLGNEPVPGVGPAELRVGTVLPERGELAELGRAMRDVLEAWAAETNAAGGIHGRKIALHVAGYDPAREGGAESARRLLDRKDLLALVSGFTPAAEGELADLAEGAGVPLVGPLTPWPAATGADRPSVFYLLGGPREQARVLAAHAVREARGAGAALVVHADDPRHADAARAGAERFRAGGWTAELVPFTRGGMDDGAVAALRARGAERVLFLGDDGDLASFLRLAADRGWTPAVLASGSLSARAGLGAPAAFRGRIVLAMPTAPTDESPSGREALVRAAHRAGGGGGERFHAARAAARAAAEVLAEGLRRAGRTVSRERLTQGLEALHAFETGVTPPLSYGPARRIGSLGAWLVAPDVDARTFRVVGWTRED